MASTNMLNQESVLQQAQHIWSMLDDMAADDPQGYRKFIDKRMKEGEQCMAPPEPHMCVQTTMCKPKNYPLFINFVSWHQIPTPQSEECPISVFKSDLEYKNSQLGVYGQISLAFNPEVLEKYAKTPHCSLVEQDELISLGLNYIEQECKVELSRKYKLESAKHKGTLLELQNSFLDKILPKKRCLGMGFSELKEMLNQLNIKESLPQHAISPNQESSENQPKLILPCQMTKLVEEIEGQNELLKPEYEMQILPRTDFNLEEEMILKIHLPGVESVEECELDVAEDEIDLAVGYKYKFHLDLQRKIHVTEARATFNQKTCQLMVTLPLIHSN